MQLKISLMQISTEKLTFMLPKPTKTYNHSNYNKRKGLQQLDIPRLPQDPLLCPMRTMLDYLARVKPVCKTIDSVFILFKDNSRPASPQTISCWAKDILRECGLPEFSARSTRSTSACNTLLMGVPLDEILSKAGWTNASTFLKNYMKPLSNKSQIKDVKNVETSHTPLGASVNRDTG